jgi:hypothetical protein
MEVHSHHRRRERGSQAQGEGGTAGDGTIVRPRRALSCEHQNRHAEVFAVVIVVLVLLPLSSF